MSFVWPPAANFAYVVGSDSINIFDTLEVDYTSTWSALNFTLFCEIGDVSTDYGVWEPRSNPMAATGTFRLDSIFTAGFGIVKFPTHCAFRITEYGNADVFDPGQFFEVISDPSTSTIWQSKSAPTSSSTSISTQSSANAVSPIIVSSAQSTDSANIGPISTELTASVTGATSTSSSFSVRPSPSATRTTAPYSSASLAVTTTDPISQQASLSAGAKAGIGIGIALVLAVILALSFLVCRLRRQVKRPAQEGMIRLKPELPAYNVVSDQKPPHIYNMQELEHTSRVELPYQHRRFGPPELEGSSSFRSE